MLDLFIHKNSTNDLKKNQLIQANHAKLFLYVSLLLNQKAWRDTREFHVRGDLLVIYRLELNRLELLRIATYSQLF
jgi:mRNA interferase YafQ